MRQFFKFEQMLTPTIIQWTFVVGTLLLMATGVTQVLTGEARDTRLIGFLVAAVGPLLLRVCCELIMVVFRVHTEVVRASEALDDLYEVMLEIGTRSVTPR